MGNLSDIFNGIDADSADASSGADVASAPAQSDASNVASSPVAPDASSAASAPQQSNMQQVIGDLSGGSQQSQPQQQPQPAQPGSLWRSVLRGALMGLQGGVPGVAAGAITGVAAPKEVNSTWDARQQMKQNAVASSNANLTYEQQRALQMTMQTYKDHKQLDQMDEDYRAKQTERGYNQMDYLRGSGATLVNIIQDDPTIAAQASADAVKKNQHLVAVHLPGADGVPGNIALYDIDGIAKAQTLSKQTQLNLEKVGEFVTPEQWARMPQQQRDQLAQKAATGLFQMPADTPMKIETQRAILNGWYATYAHNHGDDPDVKKEYKDADDHLAEAEKAQLNVQQQQNAVKTQQAHDLAFAKKSGQVEATPDKPAKPQTDMLTGTLNGQQVYGSHDELAAAGVQNMTKTPALIQTKVEAARELLEPNGLFDNVNADLRQLVKDQKIGVAASRWGDFMAGKVGSEPEFQQLRTDMGLLATKLMQAHVGNRGGKDMLQHFESLADYHISDAPTLQAALKREYQYVHGMAGRVPQPQQQKVGQ